MTENLTHVSIPLRTPIVFASGRQSYLPYKMLQLLRGIATFDVNPSTGALEMSLAASEQYIIEGPYLDPIMGALHLSPVAPSMPVSTVDGRGTDLVGSFKYVQRQVVALNHRLFKDFSRYSQKPDKVCSQAKLDEVHELMKDTPAMDPAASGLVNGALAGIRMLRQSVGKAADCSVVFMRDSAGLAQQCNYAEELAIFAHFTMEFTNGGTPETMDRKFAATTTGRWDDGIIVQRP